MPIVNAPSASAPAPRRFAFTALGLALSTLLGACGGSEPVANTPSDTPAAKPATPEGAQTAQAKTTDAPAPEAPKAAAPKAEFALPPVEIASPEEGAEPFKLAGKDLSAEACALDTAGSDMKADFFSKALLGLAIAPDGALIVLDHEQKARRYVPQPGKTCQLALDTKFGQGGVVSFPEPPSSVAVSSDGAVLGIASFKVHRYKDGKVETLDCGVESVDAAGTSGFERFGHDVKKVQLNADCPKEDYKPKGWDGKDASLSFVRPWGKDVLVAGSMGSAHFVAIHGADGKQKMKLGSAKDGDDHICFVGDVDTCAAGLCIMDSNCRSIRAFDAKKGSFVGAVHIGELLGLSYPWPVDLVTDGKGSAYMAVTHEEKKPEDGEEKEKSFYYGMIFRIKGLD